MNNIILSSEDAERFEGKYVALASLEDGKVISGGEDPEKILAEAAEKGFPNPILLFVPDKDTVSIY